MRLACDADPAASRAPPAPAVSSPYLVKTNAARLLDQLGFTCELRDYDVDPDDLSAQTVARKVGLRAEQVFKTLRARGDRTGVLLAVVAGDAELDPKALAQLSGDRRVELAPLKDVQPDVVGPDPPRNVAGGARVIVVESLASEHLGGVSPYRGCFPPGNKTRHPHGRLVASE
jgi:hypothetical protein